ncbi:MAG: signal peptide peptidase SppA [Ignavibacteriaceae bacterium]|nr:signal peptide peptidase SppA [Ignavibacteriaceae bacterium]
MKRISLIILLFAAITYPQNNNYFSRTGFNSMPAGSEFFGSFGVDNPALLTGISSVNLFGNYTVFKGDAKHQDWNAGIAIPNASFSIRNYKIDGNSVTDYHTGFSTGNNDFSLGIGYGWSKRNKGNFERFNYWSGGFVIRPTKEISISSVLNIPVNGTPVEGIISAAIRPLGNYNLTVAGDYFYRKDLPEGASKWSAGVMYEVLPGLSVAGRYFDNKSFTLSLGVGLGNISVNSISNFNTSTEYSATSYGIRIGGLDRNFASNFTPGGLYYSLSMNGVVKYQRYRLFDNSKTLLNLLTELNSIKNEENIRGIFLNLSGMNVSYVMLWEIRKVLVELQSMGKKVVVYIDEADMRSYFLASVADKIILDPQGSVMIPGFVSGRTYFKNTMEKLGLGYSEWRFMKYKSAAESYSREEMSEGEREQKQRIVDEFYNLFRSSVANSRNLAPSKIDEIVNDFAMLSPQMALNFKLVDTIARWDEISAILKSFDNSFNGFTGVRNLEINKTKGDEVWGEKPKIAVIYALGPCSMDDGINARSLIKDVQAATSDPNVKAIVFRVDSPGGSGLASDWVAEALRKAKIKKPVIVSQGNVAGSGGYWLSMYGDEILAAPNTITGSIGVIGAWIYDNGLKEKLGFSTDHVQAGTHADLGFGFTTPLIGLSIPDRNLTEKEYEVMKNMITGFYEEFKGKVSSARGLSLEKVEEIAQGRVFTGSDAVNNGLIDDTGNLIDAIKIASRISGVYDYEIVEYPEPGLFDFGTLNPFKLPSFLTEEHPVIKAVKFYSRHNGKPLFMMPAEYSFE